MNKTVAALFLSLYGLVGLINGIVILVKKQYFSTWLQNKDFLAPAPIQKISGKQAKTDGIGLFINGLFFLGLGVAIYLWGG